MTSRFRISTSTFAVFCSFLIVGLLGVHLKMKMFEQPLVIMFLIDTLHHTEASAWHKFGYYLNDIVVDLILLPLVATTVVSLVFRKFRAGAAALICIPTSLLIFYQQYALTEVGQYVPRSFMLDSIHFAISNPSLAGEYVPPITVLKFGIVLVILVMIWIAASLARRHERIVGQGGRQWWRAALVAPSVCVFVAALLVTPVSFALHTKGSPLNKNDLGRVASALLELDVNTGIRGMSFDKALADMRKLTNTPAFEATNPLVGSEKGANILIFIMETGPARALDFATDGEDLPGVGSLFDHSFIAKEQYTTYPYTSNAVYSILSGFYPQGRERLLLHWNHVPLNGLMSAIQSDTPVRRVFMPTLTGIDIDERMYQAFGAQSVYLADRQAKDPLRDEAVQRASDFIADLEKRGSKFDVATRKKLYDKLVLDFQAMLKAREAIVGAVHAHQRFCVAYLPQVAHGPWIGLHNESTVLARGRDLMLLQDQWLKEFVDLLRATGQLDHTLILFTADHGVRTRREDPALPLDTVSDYMFHVPLMIYAPHALTHTRFIDVPSSHIDIAPTVLALLGKTDAVSRMGGVPLWQRTAKDRLYLWARAYGGIDGFEQGGTYYMRQAFTGNAFSNGSVDFAKSKLTPLDEKGTQYVNHALDQANTLQETMVSRWINDRP